MDESRAVFTVLVIAAVVFWVSVYLVTDPPGRYLCISNRADRRCRRQADAGVLLAVVLWILAAI